MDVNTIYLNGLIKEEIYINQPKGFEVLRYKISICKLKKAFYGLKQAPHAWYSKIDEYLSILDFTETYANYNLYYLVNHFNMIVLVLYVGNLILTESSKKLIQWCKAKFTREFDMDDIGLMHYIPGLDVWQSPSEVFLKQSKYALEILKSFQMMDYKLITTPMVANMKSFVDSYSNLVDPFVYTMQRIDRFSRVLSKHKA